MNHIAFEWNLIILKSWLFTSCFFHLAYCFKVYVVACISTSFWWEWIMFSEKAMAPDSSTLAWRIPWTEEPGGLESMGSLRVGHDWATSLSLLTFTHWRRKWHPTPVFLPGESHGWSSLVGCSPWVAQSRTQLKRLSSSSSSRQHIKKQRHYFVNKGPSSQGCGFSSGHVWMWE